MKVNDCIHIRPNVGSIEEVDVICKSYPNLRSHVIMLSMSNYLVVMHEKSYKCFICHQIKLNLTNEKSILK